MDFVMKFNFELEGHEVEVIGDGRAALTRLTPPEAPPDLVILDVMPFYPGPGWGGHCIPIDPFYLTWKARELGISTRFIELAGEINTNMPRYVVERLREELDSRLGQGLFGARILIVGVAYKKNVDDMPSRTDATTVDVVQLRHSALLFLLSICDWG